MPDGKVAIEKQGAGDREVLSAHHPGVDTPEEAQGYQTVKGISGGTVGNQAQERRKKGPEKPGLTYYCSFAHQRKFEILNSATQSEPPFRITSQADFEVLFKTQYSGLCSYANSFLKDLDASEEVVQEVMLKVWTSRKTLVIDSSVRSYLYRAVRNGSVNVLKHLKIRDEYRSYRESEHEGSYQSHEDNMVVAELEQKIRQAIDNLPLERRKVFALSRYDGLTYPQIAEKLGISVKTVENQMGKALKSLREELADYLPLLMVFFYNWFRD